MNRTKMRFKELRKWAKFSLLCLSLMAIISCQKSSEEGTLSRNKASTVAPEPRHLLYKTYELPKATIHTLLIPIDSNFEIDLAVSETLETVEDFAQRTQAIAVINGGFFDPVNSQTTSYIVQQGKVLADPSKNPRLMDNPPLKPYLEKILNRSEFRHYQCDTITKYAIAYHQDPVPEKCKLTESIGGGPRLLPTLTAEKEAFFESVKGQITRDPLGLKRVNARTAIGITSSGDIIWIMVGQKSSSSSGLSLLELRDFLKSLDVTEAINLDGGSSSSFFYQGKSFYGKIGEEGKSIKRPVKSVLMIKE